MPDVSAAAPAGMPKPAMRGLTGVGGQAAPGNTCGGGVTGQLLGQRYRLQELVGRGAAAAVYRAVDEALNREVALKVFAREGCEPELLARQEAEIRILASLIHPGLVTLFDAGTDPAVERSFVVMEYVPGPDLRQLLGQGPMEPAGVAGIGADLASALDYVHSRGVLHRDIKPGNVLLYQQRTWDPNAQWRAKLADFGIARVMDEEHLTGTGRTVGTAAYLSPEQALGESLDGASDVYSLGLVLLECFTRHVEFPGNQIESGVARINRDPVVPAGIGAEWEALLAAMTARHSTDRPTAAEAAAALQQLSLKPGPSKAAVDPAVTARIHRPAPGLQPPLPPHPPQALPPRRRKLGKRARAAVGACAAAVILGVATSATFGGAGSGQPVEQAESAIPVKAAANNPVDFHLDQLKAALEPSAVSRTILDQLRGAVLANDLQAALSHLDRLEKDVADEASADALTFEQYRSIVSAIRLVRNDLVTLAAASEGPAAPSEGPAVEAIPAGTDTPPVVTPDSLPVADPSPVIVVAPAPAAEPAEADTAQQQEQRPAEDEAAKQSPAEAAKTKAGKPGDRGNGKGRD
ncbi:serine/threonine-protein kinase [Pseudarthrobacter sp. NamE5]|uniref:serine/threonine-protein kinase n=1 Tax=Pseudarthrobacter sp. NamE5 TaxID=2576839 RepID=UPI00110BB384|nr:serine/threonine-protein kinase [Pseudarthrobacter sp. NamE5]TLM84732.1 serine/threonine protein kinase [Pseudarthrobacter sp. NamE5]